MIRTPPSPDSPHPTYTSDDGSMSVWFKFGCAHVTTTAGTMRLDDKTDYAHICDVPAFIAFLQEAYAARTESFED